MMAVYVCDPSGVPSVCLSGRSGGGLSNSRHAGNAGRPCGGYIARAILKAVEVTFLAAKRAYKAGYIKGEKDNVLHRPLMVA